MEASSQTNVTELKSYPGLLNYYGKFLPNLATILHPLHDILQKDRPWKWTEACESAFGKSKQQLQDSSLLVHYDLKKPLRFACDASSYGAGAVTSHVMEDGTQKPIAFAQYEIEYRRSAEHANADALSRLVSSPADERLDVDEYLISYVNELPVTARDIASATRKDPVLARVYDSTLYGWPSVVANPVLQPYFSRKHELSSMNFQSTKAVCCGVYVFLSLKHIAFTCWMTCTKNIMASVG